MLKITIVIIITVTNIFEALTMYYVFAKHFIFISAYNSYVIL